MPRGQVHSDATKLKIGIGSRATRLAEHRPCSYGCGVSGNSGSLARHVVATHEFVCKYPECTAGPHKGQGYCEYHYGTYRALKKRGLTYETYTKMWNQQGGCCAICRTPKKMVGDKAATKVNVLHVDHCHASSSVRGLLCIQCNLMLGHAKDNSGVLQAAIAYLAAT